MALSFLKILKLEKRPTVTVSVLYHLDSCPIAYVTAVPNQDISKIEIAQYLNTHNITLICRLYKFIASSRI